MNDDHAHWSALLPWYVTATLAQEERDPLEAHLADCSLCQHELRQWQMIAQAVQADVAAALPAIEREAQATYFVGSTAMSLPAQQKGSFAMTILSPPTPPVSANAAPRKRLASFSVAALLLVILLVASVGWFSVAHQTKIKQGAVSPAFPVVELYPTSPYQISIHASVTDKSITLALTAIVLDKDETKFYFTVSETGYTVGFSPGGLHIRETLNVKDKVGDLEFKEIRGGIATYDALTYRGQLITEPVRQQALSAPIIVTIDFSMMTPLEQGGQPISGSWVLSFAVPQVTITEEAIHVAPITQNGTTIQPVKLVTIGANSQPDGYPGGVYLIVRTSAAFTGYCPVPFGEPAVRYAMFPFPAASPILLTGANGQKANAPIFQDDSDLYIPVPGQPFKTLCDPEEKTYSQDQIVIFAGDFGQGAATLTIPYLLMGIGDTAGPNITGPWVFTIPLN